MKRTLDLHCDVLYKMSAHNYSFHDDENLDINYLKLKEGGVKVQAMAIFIDPDIPTDMQYNEALNQLRKYQTEVITHPNIKHLTSLKEINDIQEDEIGTFLTLEGLDCIGNDIQKLEYLLDQGVLLVGMTWNSINHACDGIGEPRGAGLSSFGFEVVELLNQRDIFVDVSHISLKGFEDILKHAKHMIASHSNSKNVWNHRRNLSDEQVRAMIDKDALIHLVYLPEFIGELEVEISDLDKHIKHFIKLGASNQLGLGSDFDGITNKIINLEHAGKTQNIVDYLEKEYDEDFVDQIIGGNFMRYVNENM